MPGIPAFPFPSIAACGEERRDFSELVIEHQAAVRGFLGRYIRDQDVINDLAQDVFVAAYRNLSEYKGRAPLRIWLFGIARNKALAHLRQEVRRRRREMESLEVSVLKWRLVECEAEDPDWQASTVAALETCVGKLPDRSARMVRGFYTESRSSVDLANELGIKESGIRMALLRIRSLLRECVQSALRHREE